MATGSEPQAVPTPPTAADDFNLELRWPQGSRNGRRGRLRENGAAVAGDALSAAPVRTIGEPSSASYSTLLSSLTVLVEGVHDSISSVNDRLDAVEAAVREAGRSGGARADDPVVGDLADEVRSLRDEVAQLRRRLPVRGKSASTLDDNDLDRIATVVTERLLERLEPVESEST